MTRLSIPVGPQDHIDGPVDAPVTLVEYGDYECPYCGQAFGVLKDVQRAMGDRLRFVFRNFPISELHPHAVRAAAFAEAAAEIGKFWEAHDMLYTHQTALAESDLYRYAASIGLEDAALSRAFQGAFHQKIEGDFLGGVRSGVNGTPTLFINGVRYDGDRDVASLVEALSEAARG